MPRGRLRRDSRAVDPGDWFVACDRDPLRRATHCAEARARGAERIFAEGDTPDHRSHGVDVVADARWTWSRLHAHLHGLDLRAPLIGVTGTDGKTTVVHIAHHLLGHGAARIGTLGWHDGSEERPDGLTTPPAEELHAFLGRLPDDCPGVAMELSSHALDQRRPAALSFAGLVWTGIGRDHLDYHGSEEDYLAAKLAALRLLQPEALVVLRAEDPRVHVVEHAALSMGARVLRLGFTTGTVRLQQQEDRSWRLQSPYVDAVLPVSMPGAYNAWNAAAAALVVQVAGVGLDTALVRLATAPGVPGRMQRVAERPLVYIDYAHTPAALDHSLRALRADHPDRLLICVFGAGGDRDRGKRAPMGRCVARLADLAVVTNDNPRSEDPAAIVADILVDQQVTDDPRSWDGGCPFLRAYDRGRAIALALERAGADGVVLVAGKGHEQVQEIAGERRPWDDAQAVRDRLGGRP
ncbi:MAG: Mur ligase family protein [Planctomycetota bacterium]